MTPRLVDLPPDLTDGVHRRNGDPPPARDHHERPTPGMFQTTGRLLGTLAIAGAFVTVFALGIWKLAELVSRAL